MPFPEIDLFISPPVNATDYQSDEDSDKYDGDANINNLPGSILKARMEISGIENQDIYHGDNMLRGSSCSEQHKKKNYRKQVTF